MEKYFQFRGSRKIKLQKYFGKERILQRIVRGPPSSSVGGTGRKDFGELQGLLSALTFPMVAKRFAQSR